MSKMILNGRQYLNGTENFYDCKGVFIDTDNVTSVTINDGSIVYSNYSYTATDDCFVEVLLQGKSNDTLYVKIDGKIVFQFIKTTLFLTDILPVKKGQVVSFENLSAYAYFSVFGVQQGSAVSIQPVIYSDQEREIGVWRDGKPLYQKTFSYTPSSTISTTTPITSLSSEIEVKNLQGVCINNQNSRVISLSYSGSNLGTNFGISASNVLQIEIYNDSWGTNYTFYPTIQYTKTTDTAGSGTYTQSGVPAVHYSETEQVVGTWLNNKPLYQKTIHMSENFSSTKIYSIPTAEDLFLVDGFFVCTSGATQYQVPLNYTESGYSSYSGWNKTAHNVYFRLAGFTSTDVYATVRYTKTTD